MLRPLQGQDRRGAEAEARQTWKSSLAAGCTLKIPIGVYHPSLQGIQTMSGQGFMWIAFGVAALVVALALAGVLMRLRGTLGAVQELLDTTNDEMKEMLPEVRQTIGNVNDITAGVNVGLRTGGRGAAAFGRGVSAAVHGMKVAGQSLIRSVFGG
jgi:hypothetical protein